MKSDEEKLKELFEIKEESSFDKTVHKAKIFSVIRTSLISFTVVFILISLFCILDATLLNNKANKEQIYLKNYYNIAMPNSYTRLTQDDTRFMVGELSYIRYRILGGRVVTDGEYTKEFTYLPLINCSHSDKLEYLLYPRYKNEEEENNTFKDSYNKAGRNVMKFYNPSVDYKNYDNDIERIKEMDNNKAAEMALSFDKEYTMDEVESMLPKNVTLNWYWVNTYADENHTKFYEIDVYGIKAIDEQGEKIDNPEQNFINSMLYFKEQNLDNGLFDKIKNKETNSIDKSDLKIIGVVVSGQVSDLKSLENQSYIKASKLGAVADNY